VRVEREGEPTNAEIKRRSLAPFSGLPGASKSIHINWLPKLRQALRSIWINELFAAKPITRRSGPKN
jgi:hypothetical protein